MASVKKILRDTYGGVTGWWSKYAAALDRLRDLDGIFKSSAHTATFGQSSSDAFRGNSDVVQTGAAFIKAHSKYKTLKNMSRAEREAWEKKHNLSHRAALGFKLLDLPINFLLFACLLPGAMSGAASFLSTYFQFSGSIISTLTGELVSTIAGYAGLGALTLLGLSSAVKTFQSRAKFQHAEREMFLCELQLIYALQDKRLHASQIDSFVNADSFIKERIKNYWIREGINPYVIKQFVDARTRANQIRTKWVANGTNAFVWVGLVAAAIGLIGSGSGLTFISTMAFGWGLGGAKILTTPFLDWGFKKRYQATHRNAQAYAWKHFYTIGENPEEVQKKYNVDLYKRYVGQGKQWVAEKQGEASRVLDVHSLLSPEKFGSERFTFLSEIGVVSLRTFSRVTMSLQLLLTATQGWLKHSKLRHMDAQEMAAWEQKHNLTRNQALGFKGVDAAMITLAFIMYFPAAIASVTRLLTAQWGITGTFITFFANPLLVTVSSAAAIFLMSADSLLKTFQSSVKLYSASARMDHSFNDLVMELLQHHIDLRRLTDFIAGDPSVKGQIKDEWVAAGVSVDTINLYLTDRARVNQTRIKLVSNFIGTLVYVAAFVSAAALTSNPVGLLGISVFTFSWRVGLNKVVPNVLTWGYKNISQWMSRSYEETVLQDDAGLRDDAAPPQAEVNSSYRTVVPPAGLEEQDNTPPPQVVAVVENEAVLRSQKGTTVTEAERNNRFQFSFKDAGDKEQEKEFITSETTNVPVSSV